MVGSTRLSGKFICVSIFSLQFSTSNITIHIYIYTYIFLLSYVHIYFTFPGSDEILIIVVGSANLNKIKVFSFILKYLSYLKLNLSTYFVQIRGILSLIF